MEDDFFAFIKKYKQLFPNANEDAVNTAFQLDTERRKLAASQPGNDFVTRALGTYSSVCVVRVDVVMQSRSKG